MPRHEPEAQARHEPGGSPSRTLTDQQQAAIGQRDVSVVLSAGAGCGKTFVLTERFLSYLDPAGPDSRPSELHELIAFTYTDRAAREMRDRIRRVCTERMHAADDAHAGPLLSLWRQLDAARVGTIHGFCASLLRTHAVEAGLDPQFAVLEQAEADVLRAELIDDELRDRLERKDERIIELAATYPLSSLVERIAALLKARDKEQFDPFLPWTADRLVAHWQVFAPIAAGRAAAAIAHSPHALAVLDAARLDPNAGDVIRQRCQTFLELIPRLPDSADPVADLRAIEESTGLVGPGVKNNWRDAELHAQYKIAVEELRSDIRGVLSSVALDPHASLAVASAGLTLLDIAAHVERRYRRRKQESRWLDFDDLLVEARRLLAGPDRAELRRGLARGIRLLLVDESQDTDAVQVELIDGLCDGDQTGGKLFFVGDFKQSIYRFRGADPGVFHALRRRTPAAGQLSLTRNFRSQPAILDFVNAVFCDTFGEEYEPLVPHRPQITSRPSIEFLWAPDPGPAKQAGATARMRAREARWIARRLAGMLDRGERIVVDEDSARRGSPMPRAARPGDVAVLFRALSDVALYEAALREYDIPYYLVGGKAFYSQQEVFDVLNLLRAIASPCDDVSLAGVLRSPMFSLADETLFWLAQSPGGLGAGLMADTLASEIDADFDADQRRAARFAARTIAELRAEKDRLPIARLIGKALSMTGYDAALLAEFLGERKLANLHKLVERARALDRTGAMTLADFVVQLSRFVADQPDEALAATHAESSDVVRLMTIHQAKGLEFPVVVVADVDRERNVRPPPARFDPQLGPLVGLPSDDDKPDGAIGYDLYKLATREDDQSEVARLFYVATTRAADHLILSGGTFGIDSPKNPWTRILARRFDLATGAVRRALPDGYATPEVSVLMTEPADPPRGTSRAGRHDLAKAIEDARTMAGLGRGRVPPHVGPVPRGAASRPIHSFSRLSGMLRAHEAEAGYATGDGDAQSADRRRGDRRTPHSGGAKGGENESGVNPIALGTLVHAVLADVRFPELRFADGTSRADPAAPGGAPSIDVPSLVRRHSERQSIDDAETIAEATELVARFLDSPRARSLAAAQQMHVELEFLLAWPPDGSLTVGNPPDANVQLSGEQCCALPDAILQGFIDCLYQDAQGDWHLLDYKTNRVTPDEVPRAAAPYEMQMLLYALAAEKVLGQPPATLTLHFLRIGAERQFAWNAAAKQRALEMVGQAISKVSIRDATTS